MEDKFLEKENNLHKKLSKEEYNLRYNLNYSVKYHNYLNKRIINNLPKDKNIKILDLGCGTGFLLKNLIKKYKRVYGVEQSSDMLDKIKIKNKRLKKLMIGNAEKIPFQDDFFDAVIWRGVLHHLPDVKLALNKIHRVLKKDGTLIAMENCSDSLILKTIRTTIYKNRKKFTEKHTSFKSLALINLFIKTNFKIKNKERIGYIAFPVCGFPDMLPLLSYFPFKNTLTKILINFDEIISLIPSFNKLNWQILIKAQAR